MIIYKDILTKLKEAGYTTTRLRNDKIISESTLTKLRNNRPVSTDTIDLICEITGLQPADFMEHVND